MLVITVNFQPISRGISLFNNCLGLRSLALELYFYVFIHIQNCIYYYIFMVFILIVLILSLDHEFYVYWIFIFLYIYHFLFIFSHSVIVRFWRESQICIPHYYFHNFGIMSLLFPNSYMIYFLAL